MYNALITLLYIFDDKIFNKMIYKTDYHIHTTYGDGKSAPEEYIAPAIAARLKEIGFSEHIALFRGKEEWTMDATGVEKYLNHITNLRDNCDEIKVKIGFEVDFFPGEEKTLGKFLPALDVDYLIGAVHYIGDSSANFFDPEFYKGKNFNRLFETYFEMVLEAVYSELFDIIAHCDIIRMFGYKITFNPEPLYKKLAVAMKKHNVAFEVNTNGRNRPLADFFPDRKFLHIFCEENVPVCVNSDAHMPHRVGQYFDEAYDLLRYAGFSEMAVFENRERKMVPF